MGITGLHSYLQKASKKTHVSEFKGGTVAIDSYCWLHKGAFSCADKLAMGQTTDAYVHYCMKFVYMLLSHDIKPILVFDGRNLPAKASTETKRREARETNRRRGIELMQLGKHAEASNLLKRSLNITHELALELIKHCQELNIDCIVAPYEADAELAYLNRSGIADLVITEDSDLMLFGCKKVFFKMDMNGYGVLVDNDRLHLVMDVKSEHFEMDKFLYMCILSGCDYLPSLPGIGLGKAKKFIAMNSGSDIDQDLMRLGSCLKMKNLEVTKEYRDLFILAVITFKHQLVFCPLQRKQVRLTPPPPDVTDEQLHYAGQSHPEDLAFQLALGNCHPSTHEMLHNYDPDALKSSGSAKNKWHDKKIPVHPSIWSRDFVLKKHEGFSSPRKTNSWSTSVGRQTTLEITRFKRMAVEEEAIENLDNAKMLKTYSEDAIVEEKQQQSDLDISIESEPSSPVLVRRANIFSQEEPKNVSPSLLQRRRSRKRHILRARRTIFNESAALTECQFFGSSLQEENIVDHYTKEKNTSPDVNVTTERKIDKNIAKLEESLSDTSGDADWIDVSHVNQDTRRTLLESQESNIGVSNSLQTNYDSQESMRMHEIDEVVEEVLVEEEDLEPRRSNFFKYANTNQQEKAKLNRTSSNSSISKSPKNIKQVGTMKRRHKKQTVIAENQQSLLSMFGFNKRGKLQH